VVAAVVVRGEAQPASALAGAMPLPMWISFGLVVLLIMLGVGLVVLAKIRPTWLPARLAQWFNPASLTAVKAAG
jgi:hypothetical protein